MFPHRNLNKLCEPLLYPRTFVSSLLPSLDRTSWFAGTASVPPTQLPPPPPPPGLEQSQASVLGPDIAGPFVQGIETGLVLAQWFSLPERSENSILSAVVIFSRLCFASAWCNYVQQFGMFLLPSWEDYVHPIPSLNPGYIGSRSSFDDPDAVITLVGKNIVSNFARRREFAGLFLTRTPLGFLLCYLTRTMKRVYAVHKRKRILRLANIYVPPFLPLFRILSASCPLELTGETDANDRLPVLRKDLTLELWTPIFQQVTWKFYVLSLLYDIYAQPLGPGDRPTTIMSTLTVPTEAIYISTREARGGDASCGNIAAERGTARTVDFAV
ncbi:hypothetical protein EDB84DRAFT_1561401 [Lactarius hengduanensis]|nr:hypothetical protein EDB84DRAFT_1561401 [Lactarius hengduanensis]